MFLKDIFNHVNVVTLFTVPEHAKFKTYAAFGDRREGVVSSRTYFYEGEEQCDKNMQIFLEAIDGVSGWCLFVIEVW